MSEDDKDKVVVTIGAKPTFAQVVDICQRIEERRKKAEGEALKRVLDRAKDLDW